jgi:hypothetical protein
MWRNARIFASGCRPVNSVSPVAVDCAPYRAASYPVPDRPKRHWSACWVVQVALGAFETKRAPLGTCGWALHDCPAWVFYGVRVQVSLQQAVQGFPPRDDQPKEFPAREKTNSRHAQQQDDPQTRTHCGLTSSLTPFGAMSVRRNIPTLQLNAVPLQEHKRCYSKPNQS